MTTFKSADGSTRCSACHLHIDLCSCRVPSSRSYQPDPLDGAQRHMRPRLLAPSASNELFASALRLRQIEWCRARLLHAFAGAARQGVLLEVLEELLDEDSGPEDGFEIHERVVRALKATGWLSEQEVPK